MIFCLIASYRTLGVSRCRHSAESGLAAGTIGSGPSSVLPAGLRPSGLSLGGLDPPTDLWLQGPTHPTLIPAQSQPTTPLGAAVGMGSAQVLLASYWHIAQSFLWYIDASFHLSANCFKTSAVYIKYFILILPTL